MSRGKYKRKRENRENQIQQPLSDDPALLGNNDQEAGDPETSQPDGRNSKEPLMGFRKLAERSSLTDWIIVLFTGVLTFTAIYQYSITDRQLDTMRKDQRPWMKISFTMDPLQALGPVRGVLSWVNIGKTPARNIRGDFAIETVRNGEQPKLRSEGFHLTFATGMIMPNDTPGAYAIQRARPVGNAPGESEADVLSAPELQDFNELKIFFVVYGIIHYADFFAIEHWTKFCEVMYTPNPPPGTTFTGHPCAVYADVDSN
jgi:hypothetical protein